METAGRIPAEFLVPLLGTPSEDISTTVTPPFRYLACCPPPGVISVAGIGKSREARLARELDEEVSRFRNRV